jgi:hypothetical protein
MKKKKQVKKVTFPKNNHAVFEAIAQGMVEVIKNPSSDHNERKELIDGLIQEMAGDSYMVSFTSEGHIRDGKNHLAQGNPNTPRISDSFYDGFRDLLGVKGDGSSTDGKITKMLKQNTNSDRKVKTRMIRFKGATINLVQLYLEAALSLVSTDKNTYAQKKNKEKIDRERITSFNYKKRPKGMSDSDWLESLISVEENRYMRMFIATIFFKTIADLFLVSSTDVYKTIKSQDLLGVNGLTPKKKFAKLRQPSTRETFVEKVRELWNLELQPLRTKKPRKSKNKDISKAEEIPMSFEE